MRYNGEEHRQAVRHVVCALALILTSITLAASSAYSQVPQGEILGTVTDIRGAVIPKVTVILESELTGIKRTAEANDRGDYNFSRLDSGTYRVTVQMSGFKTAVYSGNQVQAAEKSRVDVRLEPGEIGAIVEVTGGAALLQTDSPVVGSIVSQREVVGMPLNGREFSQLAVLMPGVRAIGTNGGDLITQFSTAIQVGGTSSNKNSYSVDGVDNTLNVWNGPAMNPSIDSIQEFRIDRSQFPAEYGRGGAEVQLVTKSGTNQFHGAAWEYLRNYNFNAGNYITHTPDLVKRHQFGANLGGPIILPRFGEGRPAFYNGKNRAFFFFNWESQREQSSVQPLGSVFTDKMRQGNLSEFSQVITDPQTGQPFQGNIIPASRFNPVTVALMEAMMGRATSSGLASNFIRPFTTSRDYNQFISRIDYQASKNDSLFFRLNIQPRTGISAPLSATSINHHEVFRFDNSGVGWIHTWSSKLVSETRFGYHREKLLLESQPPATLPSLAIKGFGPVQPPQDRLPVVFISPFYHFAEWAFPLGFTQNSYELIQNATINTGNHLIKAGFTGRRQGLDKNKSQEYFIIERFTGFYTGNGVADFLLGLPRSASETLGFVPRKQRYGDYSAFVQDDWKVTPNLTLSVGLRYELDTLPSEKQNLWGNFSPERRKIVLAGDRIVTEATDPFILNAFRGFLITADQTNLPKRTLVFPDRNNFAPRFGFAWRPFGNNKTVVRGGYGIFYVLEDGNNAFNNTDTVPYGGGVSVLNTRPNPTFTADNPFSAGVAAPPPPSAYFRDPHMRTGYLQQTTFGIQRELPWRLVGEINFQDQNSKKLETSWNLNQPPPGPGSINSRLPFPEFGPSILGTLHEGYSRYDALEMLVRKSSKHYTFQWSHTWAKNLGRLAVADPFNRDIFKGPLDYVPHLDKLHFLIDLPVGRGRSWLNRGGVADAVLGGWTISGIAILHQSGSPLTIEWDGDPADVGAGGARPNRICSGRLRNPTPDKWFDTSCFVEPTPGTFGNSGTGILFGPPRRSFDFGLYKNFAIRENVKLQFRTEMFNAFNHPNLQNPFTVANSPLFGQILSKDLDPRVIQFALRLTF